MRITIVTLGSRGDVQPYVALGLGLQHVGHTVRLATWARNEALVTQQGLAYAPIYRLPRDIHLAEGASSRLAAWRHSLKVLVQMADYAEAAMTRSLADCLAACQDADVIVTSMTAAGLAPQVAEALRRPCYPAYYLNMARTCAYPSSLSPVFPESGAYNWLSYSLVDDALWQVLRPYHNTARRAVLGHGAAPLPLETPLTALWRQRQPHLYGFSPAVLPRAPEWGDWVHETGYWFLDGAPGWQPPAALLDFLDDGPPPVYIGFGSMPHQDAEELTWLVLKALALCGQRAVLAAGWGGLGARQLPENVFPIDEAPHDWLFARMSAVVHHGGAGTTAAGLRAGVPAVVVPFYFDQPFWGNRVWRLGVGPRPIPRTALTAERLAAAIHAAVTDPRMRARAADLGRQIRAEDGVGQAVEIFHRHPAKVPGMAAMAGGRWRGRLAGVSRRDPRGLAKRP